MKLSLLAMTAHFGLSCLMQIVDCSLPVSCRVWELCRGCGQGEQHDGLGFVLPVCLYYN